MSAGADAASRRWPAARPRPTRRQFASRPCSTPCPICGLCLTTRPGACQSAGPIARVWPFPLNTHAAGTSQVSSRPGSLNWPPRRSRAGDFRRHRHQRPRGCPASPERTAQSLSGDRHWHGARASPPTSPALTGLTGLTVRRQTPSRLAPGW